MNKSVSLTKLIFPSSLALILLIVLIILVPITLISISEVMAPVLLWVKSVIFEESIKNNIISPVSVIFRLFAIFTALYLIFILHSIVLAIYTENSYKIAAQNFFLKEYDQLDLIFRAINWSSYRLLYILYPPLVVGLASISLFIILLYTFNLITFIAGINIALVTFIATFIALCLIITFFSSFLVSVWNGLTTIFGIECAISQPDLPNKVIKERSKRLILAQSSNYNLHILYFLFNLLIMTQAAILIFFSSLISKENLTIILILVIIDFVYFIGLSYLKASSYLNSVQAQYNKVTINNRDNLKKANFNFGHSLF